MSFPVDRPRGVLFIVQKHNCGCCVQNRLERSAWKRGRRTLCHQGKQWGWDLGGGLEGEEESHPEHVLKAEVRGFLAWSQGTFCLPFPPTGTPDSKDSESQALLSSTGSVAENL